MLNVMPDEIKPNSTYDILQLVSKNKAIPDFLHTLTLENSKVLELVQAIKQGDASSVIWNDPNCNLYLLYLMEQNIVPFWEGITAYAYLMAKMQYTSTQNLREEDADIKLDYKIVIELLVKGNQITELGENYLQGVCDGLEKVGFIIKVAELKKYVLKLPPIEQWLIRTEFNHHAKDEPNSDRLMSVLLSNLPFLQKTPDSTYEDLTTRYLVPSSSLINFLLKKINSDPIQMKPIFGNIGLKKLYDWHEADFHPVALYATQIKSNPKEADGHRCGPFPMWLHDVAHTFWASMLSKEDRLFIFQQYIPALKILHQEAEKYNDKGALEYLEEAIKKAYDFDLTNISDSADKKTRLNKYIRGTFSKSLFSFIYGYSEKFEFEPIGGHPGDGLYFLLNKFSNDSHCHESHQDIYRTILRFIPTGKYYRQQSVVDALRAIAINASKNPNDLFIDNKGIDIYKANWTAWSELLNSSMTNEEIWNKSVKYDCKGVNLFYPYLPLTDHKREQFQHFVQEQLGKKSTSCNYGYQSGSRESFFSNDIRRYSPFDKIDRGFPQATTNKAALNSKSCNASLFSLPIPMEEENQANSPQKPPDCSK